MAEVQDLVTQNRRDLSVLVSDVRQYLRLEDDIWRGG
jgi:hypothetical protein